MKVIFIHAHSLSHVGVNNDVISSGLKLNENGQNVVISGFFVQLPKIKKKTKKH